MSEEQGVYVANTVFVGQTGAKFPDYWAGPGILYKYRQTNLRALESLALNQIWFAQPKTFNDPFESSKFLDEKTVEKMISLWQSRNKRMEEAGAKRANDFVINQPIEDSGVFCLCRSASNLAMWSYYGANEGGVGLGGFCVGYDPVRLLEELVPVNPCETECTTRNRYVLDVVYCAQRMLPDIQNLLDPDIKVIGPELQKMHAWKAVAFKHEEEIRIVIPPFEEPPPLQELSSEERNPPSRAQIYGYGAYSHAPDAIREIVFGELIDKEHEQAIRKIMEGREVVFKRAIRDPKTMGVVIEPDSGKDGT